MPAGPRCFKCKIVSPSGPVAVEFLHWWMTVAVWLAVNGVKERSSMCSRFTRRRVRRRSGSREWTTVPVNCLEKWRAMAVGLEQTLVLPPREKEIGWLGEALGLLPERLRIVDQNLLALDLYETEEMKVLHLVRAVDLVRESISALRTRTAGSAGFRALRASGSSMSR